MSALGSELRSQEEMCILRTEELLVCLEEGRVARKERGQSLTASTN